MPHRTPIRHGEVLLYPVDSVPPGAVEQVKRCIVGHSESGHHHVLEADTAFTEIRTARGDLFVDLDAATPLRHRKMHHQHRELVVAPGKWRVLRKTEFDVTADREPPDSPAVKPERSADLALERPVRRRVRD